MHYLTEMKAEVQQFAEVISEALHVESEIIAENYEVVASTSFVFQGERTDWSDSNSKICRHVFETMRPLVLSDPGTNKLCEDCIEKDCCFYTAGLYYPILLEGKCHGIISLAAFTETQKQSILLNSYSFLRFTSKMAEILAAKVRERMTQDALRNTNEYLQTILSSVREAIIACDAKGIITCFNDRAASLLGLDGDAVLGQSLEELLPDSLLLKALAGDADLVESHVQYLDKNGEELHFISNVSLIHQDGKLQGAIESFNTDVSFFRIAQRLLRGDGATSFSEIIGESHGIQVAKAQAIAVAKSPSTVLITGESGTGKELFARAIHNASLRCDAPFVPVNCGAIPENLLESELFGYERGAFTGANPGGKPGLLEMAQGGTVFLDEIGDMSPALQVKLLRVLQGKVIQRLGSAKPISVDVRIIAATNQNLAEKLAKGTFREDLYYRLNVIPLSIPPLRTRPDDIPLLIHHFCRKFSVILGKEIDSISEDALQLLSAYNWPGNVRELENAIEYAINYTLSGSAVTAACLPAWITSAVMGSISAPGPKGSSAFHPQTPAEVQEIAALLREKGTSLPAKKEIAASLHISLATLYRKIKKYQL